MSNFNNSVRFGKNIYPDVELEDIAKINATLKKCDSEVVFLYDDGIEIKYGEKIEPKDCPGDISFYWVGTNDICYTVTVMFDSVLFSDPFDNTIISIPTL